MVVLIWLLKLFFNFSSETHFFNINQGFWPFLRPIFNVNQGFAIKMSALAVCLVLRPFVCSLDLYFHVNYGSEGSPLVLAMTRTVQRSPACNYSVLCEQEKKHGGVGVLHSITIKGFNIGFNISSNNSHWSLTSSILMWYSYEWAL